MSAALDGFLPSLRTHLLLAMGLVALPACGKDDDDDGDDTGDTGAVSRTCSDLPRHDASAAWDGNGMRVLSCIQPDAAGLCPAKEDVQVWDLVLHSDPLCGYDGEVVCGPEAAIADACCYEVRIDGEWCEGRPFAADGPRRVAPEVGSRGWCAALDLAAEGLAEDERRALAAWWARAAADEHASVASFARVVLELMALGAPADLVMAATRAQVDEIAHARTCYGVATALRGQPVGPGALDVAGALDAAADPARILRDTLRGGAIGEALAAARARAAAEAATAPLVRELLLRIAEDEARHAALAWRTARWLLARHPELHPVAAAVLAQPPAQLPDPVPGAPAGWGALPPDEVAAVHAAAFRAVIAPCTAALLGAPAAPVAHA